MVIQMAETNAEVMSFLFPGFTFDPNDMQLLLHYLRPKILGQLPDGHYINMLPEVNVLHCEPWELHSRFSHMFSSEKLFFFCQLKPKYKSDRRCFDRTTEAGYWKPTGKGRPIQREDTGVRIGEKRTLVFYKRHNTNVERTSWVMHEYHLNPKCLGDDHDENEVLPYVVCWIKNNKDKKQMTGHAPDPVNQEGDDSSFPENQHNEVVATHSELPVGDSMESLPQSWPPDAMSSDHTTLVHQPQAGAEHGSPSLPGFSRGDDGTGLDFLLSPPPDGDDPFLPNICPNCNGEFYFSCDCNERQS